MEILNINESLLYRDYMSCYDRLELAKWEKTLVQPSVERLHKEVERLECEIQLLREQKQRKRFLFFCVKPSSIDRDIQLKTLQLYAQKNLLANQSLELSNIETKISSYEQELVLKQREVSHYAKVMEAIQETINAGKPKE